MIVISDTSSISYLFLIGAVDVLPALYGEVVIPLAVQEELMHPNSPAREWIQNPPLWLKTASAQNIVLVPGLHLGEVEAISLAIVLSADRLLVDDKPARLAAKRRNIKVAGTIAVLMDAAEHGLIDLELAFGRLQQTSFRASREWMSRLLNEFRNRLS